MGKINDQIQAAYEVFRQKVDFQPDVALVLGSGLGGFSSELEISAELPYSEIPGFPVSTAPGHVGRYLFGTLNGQDGKKVRLVLMQGRVHYYEGYPMEMVVLPARLIQRMGAKVLFLTNAAGGCGDGFHPGCLMMITDHIACFVQNPLIGPNEDEIGLRFPDMSQVYDLQLQEQIRAAAREEQIELFEGVYAQLTGPSYETPAEIRMLKSLGASAVGMSTAVEAIAAHHAGMRICGVSCITNMAAGLSAGKLSEEEVLENAQLVADKFQRLVKASILRFGETLEVGSNG